MVVQGHSPRWRFRGQSPPEAESSVAFEGPAEEPNLTLLPAISRKFGGAKLVVFGG